MKLPAVMPFLDAAPVNCGGEAVAVPFCPGLTRLKVVGTGANVVLAGIPTRGVVKPGVTTAGAVGVP